MRDELEHLIEDVTLLTIAFALALGWSLYQLAHGAAAFIDGLATHLPADESGGFGYSSAGGGLTWVVGRHIVALDSLVGGLLELTFVLVVAALVRSRIHD